VTIARHVGLIESPEHVAVETMKEAMECDVGSVCLDLLVNSVDVAEGFGQIGWHKKHAYMKQDAPLAMDGTWHSFFQAVRIRRTRVFVDQSTEGFSCHIWGPYRRLGSMVRLRPVPGAGNGCWMPLVE
jgi:hypothetical protein